MKLYFKSIERGKIPKVVDFVLCTKTLMNHIYFLTFTSYTNTKEFYQINLYTISI